MSGRVALVDAGAPQAVGACQRRLGSQGGDLGASADDGPVAPATQDRLHCRIQFDAEALHEPVRGINGPGLRRLHARHGCGGGHVMHGDPDFEPLGEPPRHAEVVGMVVRHQDEFEFAGQRQAALERLPGLAHDPRLHSGIDEEPPLVARNEPDIDVPQGAGDRKPDPEDAARKLQVAARLGGVPACQLERSCALFGAHRGRGRLLGGTATIHERLPPSRESPRMSQQPASATSRAARGQDARDAVEDNGRQAPFRGSRVPRLPGRSPGVRVCRGGLSRRRSTTGSPASSCPSLRASPAAAPGVWTVSRPRPLWQDVLATQQ